MATLDTRKVLLLKNKTKLTLTVTLTPTDTVMQKSKNKLTLTVALTLTDRLTVNGVCGWARFFHFLTFYPFADKNLIESSYFIVEKRVFCGDI